MSFCFTSVSDGKGYSKPLRPQRYEEILIYANKLLNFTKNSQNLAYVKNL